MDRYKLKETPDTKQSDIKIHCSKQSEDHIPKQMQSINQYQEKAKYKCDLVVFAFLLIFAWCLIRIWHVLYLCQVVKVFK